MKVHLLYCITAILIAAAALWHLRHPSATVIDLRTDQIHMTHHDRGW